MRDDQYGCAHQPRPQAAEHLSFGLRIERRGGLVEDHHGGIPDECAGDGDEATHSPSHGS